MLRYCVAIGIIAGLAAVPGGQTAIAAEPGLQAELSWQWMRIPDSAFVFQAERTIVEQPSRINGVLQSLETSRIESAGQSLTNHDGRFDGPRIDLSLGALPLQVFGHSLIAGARGFYAHEKGGGGFACPATPYFNRVGTGLNTVDTFGGRFCTTSNLYDTGPGIDSSGSRADQNAFFTERSLTHWGVAAELETARSKAAGASSISYRGGIDYRRIDQDLSVFSVPGPNAFEARNINGVVTVVERTHRGFGSTYDEKLDTGYLGPYLGLSMRLPVASGLSITLDGDAGAYWAHTKYAGRYTAIDRTAGTSTVTALDLEADKLAFVTALKVGAEQDFGTFRFGVFARGEYYSYAPEMRYNSQEQATTAGLVATGEASVGPRGHALTTSGGNAGTSIDNGSAWALSAGARVTVPFK